MANSLLGLDSDRDSATERSIFGHDNVDLVQAGEARGSTGIENLGFDVAHEHSRLLDSRRRPGRWLAGGYRRLRVSQPRAPKSERLSRSNRSIGAMTPKGARHLPIGDDIGRGSRSATVAVGGEHPGHRRMQRQLDISAFALIRDDLDPDSRSREAVGQLAVDLPLRDEEERAVDRSVNDDARGELAQADGQRQRLAGNWSAGVEVFAEERHDHTGS